MDRVRAEDPASGRALACARLGVVTADCAPDNGEQTAAVVDPAAVAWKNERGTGSISVVQCHGAVAEGERSLAIDSAPIEAAPRVPSGDRQALDGHRGPAADLEDV